MWAANGLPVGAHGPRVGWLPLLRFRLLNMVIIALV